MSRSIIAPINFTNGSFDLRTNLFTAKNSAEMKNVAIKCNHYYVSYDDGMYGIRMDDSFSRNVDEILSLLNDLFTKDMLPIVWKHLSDALVPNDSNTIYIYNGLGKSLFTRLIKQAFGDYFRKYNSNNQDLVGLSALMGAKYISFELNEDLEDFNGYIEFLKALAKSIVSSDIQTYRDLNMDATLQYKLNCAVAIHENSLGLSIDTAFMQHVTVIDFRDDNVRTRKQFDINPRLGQVFMSMIIHNYMNPGVFCNK